jgi:serine/threonine-protein kinase
MALEPGSRLGSYEITSLLGVGGMGEVYRARDLRLGRDVALKILPVDVRGDPGRLARFEREARSLAALNHPHIAAIYGVEESGDIRALVLEFVEGETLAARLTRGPLPLAEALSIAHQVASAIEAAHERGIVHRDLKPANVQLKPNGTAKVLDLGLARMTETAASVRPVEEFDTVTGATAIGTILGTAGYMSPEQARGESVDGRSDIWAQGCILFEMLSGHSPFRGPSTVDVLAAVLEREPEWSRLPPMPPALRTLLERCLRKNAGRRLQHSGDLRIELEDILEGAPAPARRPAWQPPVLAAALVATLVAGLWLWNTRSRPAAPGMARSPLHASLRLPSDVELTLGSTTAFAISPDGKNLVLSAERKGRRSLFMRTLDDVAVRAIDGTEDGTSPFFSPDGQWIGFFARGDMKKVALAGGAPIVIAHAASRRGATWQEDGTIILSPEPDGGLLRVSAAGGPVHAVTTTDMAADEIAHRWPAALPGGKAVLFTVFTGVESDSLIKVLSTETGEQKLVITGGTNPMYIPGRTSPSHGELLYARNADLFVCPFDVARREVTGATRRVATGIQQRSVSPAAFSVSADGTLIYVPGIDAGQVLVWVDSSGNERLAQVPVAHYWFPRLSPSGRQLLITKLEGGNFDLWTYDLSSTQWIRLTLDRAFDAAGVWSPDGRQVAFRSFRQHPFNIFWKPADPSAPERRVTTKPANQIVHAWTPDGRGVIYSELGPTGQISVWSAAVQAEEPPKLLLRDLTAPVVAAPSPNGKWLAYTSTESEVPEVFVARFDADGRIAAGARAQISLGGGTEPVWSADGGTLYYRTSGRMMAVTVDAGDVLRVGQPRPVFADQYARTGEFVNYAVTRDRQFLMVKAENSGEAELRIVSNLALP